MRIEELVIDGFKSYHGRTRITDWDASFNAITGLNGSGKSNILDAICFVLGITNMSAMRAQNQTDLIYKRGTAGVTKASVTIVFNNSDRSKSPLGLEKCPTITVTRQVAMPNISKYLLNGHKATQQSIQNIFQSVQLNINNPNFVIMQGKITKVLNMKPPEILSLVEEAAGTRMFEDRKDKAKRQMDKKQRKVDELIATLDEEVKPKLDKRRKQRSDFLEYQKASIELEKVGRLLHAWEWVDANEHISKREGEVAEKERDIKARKDTTKLCKQEIKASENACKEVEKRRDAEMSKGGKLAKLKEEVAEGTKEVRKMAAQVELKENDIKDEEKHVDEFHKAIEIQNELLDDKCTEIQDRESASEEVSKAHKVKQDKVTDDEELLQTLLTGVSNTKANQAGGGGGYLGALQNAQKREADGASEEQQAQGRLAMTQTELKETQAKFKTVKGEAEKGKAQLAQMQHEVDGMKIQIEATGWNSEKEHALINQGREAKDAIRHYTDKRESLRHQLGRADFQYTPPPNFDTRKVKGTAARLIRIQDGHQDKATALELAAGGRLYHLVVEDDTASSRILNECRLKQRVTLIPLNKINANGISPLHLKRCHEFAKGRNFWPALDIISSSPDVAKAMPYVFSDTVICEDTETANLITFKAGVRSVTVQGDVYETGGTLSGGSAPSGSGILLKVQEILKLDMALSEAISALHVAETELVKNQSRREKWRKLTEQLEMKVHELSLLEQQVGGSSASRIEAQIEEIDARIASLKAEVAEAKQKQIEAKGDVKRLKKDMDEFKNNKEGKIEELRASINKQKSDLQKHHVAVTTKKKELQAANLEKDQIESDIQRIQVDIGKAEKNLQKFKSELKKMKEQLSATEKLHAEAEFKLKDELTSLSRFDDELKRHQDTIAHEKSQIGNAERDIEKFQHSLVQIEKEKKTWENRITNLEQTHDWIEGDSHEFGKRGGRYDFSGQNLEGIRAHVKKLEESQAGKKKKVNPRVMAELETLEKQEKKLSEQLDQVLRDKNKIESTIDELDGYKREALSTTWEKVNSDFGAIFGELLPGNFSKLEPTEGGDLIQGLEVKVRLGSVWKQSLTELSGGQRSLIALSLIMALLQFKPAPMYILDEIDAALDLSHTQHIGHLFRTRFKGSQFIVVSLKEGLFTNANVLFRARFRDGTSIVERTANRSSSTLYNS